MPGEAVAPGAEAAGCCTAPVTGSTVTYSASMTSGAGDGRDEVARGPPAMISPENGRAMFSSVISAFRERLRPG